MKKIKFILIFLGLLLIILIAIPNLFNDTLSRIKVDLLNGDKYYTSLIKKDGWNRINLGNFTIDAPDYYRYVKHSNSERLVGELVGKGTRLYFNYGSFGGFIDNLQKDEKLMNQYLFTSDTIQGATRIWAIPKGKGQMAVQVHHFSENDSSEEYRYILGVEILTTSKNYDQEEITEIFKTISLKN